MPAEAVRGFVGDGPIEVVVPDTRDRAGLHAVLADADLVLGDWSGGLRIGPAEIEVAKRLAFVQQPSVGVELLDLDALAAAGIPVANAAGANDISVAEWCVAATLDLARSITWADGAVRRGEWPQIEIAARGCSELTGKRVGIVGFGPIGIACARLYSAFGCPVSYWSRRRRDESEAAGTTYRELGDLLTSSDVLVVVVAKAPATTNLIGAAELAALPRGALLVNAARGGIVDEGALLDAVEAGALGGAALDVYDGEPLALDSPLRRSDRILLSPHAAGATMQGQIRVVERVRENFARVVRGEPVISVCNGVDPLVRRR
jgi:phosphoglycerate dehydrogenase-like enzyme